MDLIDLPNTVAMDDMDSDDPNEDQNHHNNNNNNTDVRGYLVRIDRNGLHQTPFILTKETTTIGRQKSNDIVLTNPTISSNHAELIIDTGQSMAYIVDLKSTNCSRIGSLLPSNDHKNKKLKPNRECIVKSGDYVTFGDVHFIFYHEDDYDRYQQQQLSNHGTSADHSIHLLATQAFDEPLEGDGGISVTAANTAANRSNKQEVDLKLSLSDDEQMKQPSPKRVQFVDVNGDSPQSNTEVNTTSNMEPTLEWGEDDDDTDGLPATMAFDDMDGPLAATMAFDDMDETTQEEEAPNGNIPLPATMAFGDEDEAEDHKPNELAATMAFEDEDQAGLPPTLAFEDADEFESDHNNGNGISNETSELLATMVIGDDEDEPLPATMVIEDEEANIDALPATVAMDDDADDTELAATMAIEDEEDEGRADLLPATVAMDDEDEDQILAATMAIDDDDDDDAHQILPATVAMDDEDDDDNVQDALPATVAMDDDDDVENGEGGMLEATMPMDDDDDITLSGSTVNGESNRNHKNEALPATVAMEDDDETQEEDEDPPLAATMAIEDTEEDEPSELAATMDILHSEKRPALDATLAVMTDEEEEEEAKEEPLSATMKIDTDDIDLEDDTVDSNTNNTNHASPAMAVMEDEEAVPPIIPSPKEPEPPPPPPPQVPPKPVISSVRRGRRPRRRATKPKEEEKAEMECTDKAPPPAPVVPKRRRSARIARRNSLAETADEDGDIQMENNQNKPIRKSTRNKKKPVSSLNALFANRGNRSNDNKPNTNKKRGRKRNMRDREEDEDANSQNEESNTEDNIHPPPAKRPRRGRVATRSKAVAEKPEEDTTNNGLRRSARTHHKHQKSKPRKQLQDYSSEEEDYQRVVLLRTGTDNKSEKIKLEALGAVVLTEYDDSVTHIVSTQPRRTLKFISGMATAKYIVTDAWPTQCVKKGTLQVDESKYFPHNKATREFEKKYGFKLKESFARLQEREEALFDGYKVYFTKDIKANVKKAIGTMAQSHGAAWMSRVPKATRSGEEVDATIIVIGEDRNNKYCKSIARKGYAIYNREVIITSILRQEINLDEEEFYLT